MKAVPNNTKMKMMKKQFKLLEVKVKLNMVSNVLVPRKMKYYRLFWMSKSSKMNQKE